MSDLAAVFAAIEAFALRSNLGIAYFFTTFFVIVVMVAFVAAACGILKITECLRKGEGPTWGEALGMLCLVAVMYGGSEMTVEGVKFTRRIVAADTGAFTSPAEACDAAAALLLHKPAVADVMTYLDYCPTAPLIAHVMASELDPSTKTSLAALLSGQP